MISKQNTYGKLEPSVVRLRAMPLKAILLILGFLIQADAHAALFSATWVAGTAGGTTATGTIGSVGITLTTVGVGNSTQIFPGTWSQILPPSLGVLSPDRAIALGYQCNGSPQTQQVQFTSPVTNPYLLFNYVEGDSSYNFSSVTGAVTLVGNTVTATQSGKVVTLPAGSFNRSNDGFAVQLTGNYTSITYTITKSSCSSGHDSVGFDVAEDGFAVTPSATGGGTISPNQVVVVIPNTSASFTVTPSSGYSVNMGGTCGGSLAGTTYTTLAVGQDCTVAASFSANPQATLYLTANPTGINVGGNSTLSTSGGSGTGAVTYNASGPCTIVGNVLTGTSVGTCVVTATKAGDSTYVATTSNAVTVVVGLSPQATLNLSASSTSIIINGTSTLSTTGGSGSGAVTYNVLSGPCLLNSNVLTGTGQGDCQVQASKAADSTYSSTTSNIVTVHVDLDPQATLLLNANPTGIDIGQTSALSTSGGSGTGAVTYAVVSGPCTIAGSTLTGTGQGDCQVQATKAADSTYSTTTSNIVTVHVDLDPQATLLLNANPTGIDIGQTSALSTSGGSGTGAVTYAVVSGPCTIAGSALTGTGQGDCQVQATKAADSTYSTTTSNIVTVHVDLDPQATLLLNANPTGIDIGQTSALSTSGGSGTGAVTYAVVSGPCTIAGSTLTGTGQGDCQVQAIKAADSTYSSTTSNVVTVHVDLDPQATLLLNANPTGIDIGQTSALSTSGGSGTGAVVYAVLSGPCTISGSTLTGTGQGDCQVQAIKAADSTYSSTTSNVVTVHVDLDPQATLLLNANPTGIDIGQTSALSTSGGSGTGAVTYAVVSGPCTISGNILIGKGQGSCLVQATKAADAKYASVTSNTVTVHVNLDPQAPLNVKASPSTIPAAGTSVLSTTGGSGNGAVTYSVLSGPCKLSGNIVIASQGTTGICVVEAHKAASSPYAAASALVSITVTAIPPLPNPIPTMTDWAKLVLILLLTGTAGWFNRRSA